MKKILYCASTISHINNFHIPYLKAFHDKRYEVWVLANKKEPVMYADRVVSLPLQKNIMSFENIKAIFAARKLMKEQDFDIVSTHTTLASAVVRAGVMLLKKKPKVFNTCHGYLFGENDGLKKWVYLLPEKICASVTDVLMVMNHEDYDIAENHKLYKDKLYYINGMGIDLSKFQPASQEEKLEQRAAHGYSKDDFLFVYAAEFSKRKNQELLIRAFSNVCKEMPYAKLLLAGNGALLENCKTLVKELHADGRIQFMGYIKDMRSLYTMCDVSVSTSRIEGLPFNVMESMACGLAVIASDIKGHRELVDDGVNGYLFESENQKELEILLDKVYKDMRLSEFWKKALENVNKFGIAKLIPGIMAIYGM